MHERSALFSMASSHNLYHLVEYYKRVSMLLSQTTEELEQSADRMKLVNAKKYGEIYPRLFCNSVFLMMYSWLEEHLHHASRTPPFKELTIVSGNGIEKYKPLFRKALGDRFGESDDWQFLKDTSEARHCLLHAAGRVDLMRSPEKIERILDSRGDCFSVERKRMHVQPPALNGLANSSKRLLDALIDHFEPIT